MARDQVDMTPIETREELVAWFEAGSKPRSRFRLGTEHEKFVFTVEGHNPVSYQGRRSIRALLEGMQHLLGWEPIIEDGNIIGLFDVTDVRPISLEPGGLLQSLARYGSRALRHAAVGVRAWYGLRALRRLRPRRAHVFRQARPALYRRGWPIVPRPDAGKTPGLAGRARHDLRLGEPHLHDLPGSAAQALSRNAWRGRWSVAQIAASACLLGRDSLR